MLVDVLFVLRHGHHQLPLRTLQFHQSLEVGIQFCCSVESACNWDSTRLRTSRSSDPAASLERLDKRVLQKHVHEIHVGQPRPLLGQIDDLQLHVTDQPLTLLAQTAIPADIGKSPRSFRNSKPMA